MLLLQVAAFLSALPLALAQGCNADNCYRAVRAYQASTSTGFCSGYLASETAAPSPFATCGPSRLTSACNCLATASATTTTTSATATSSPGNLIINGGFESGAISPWTATTNSGYFEISDNSQSTPNFPFRARSGTKFLQIGNPGDENPESISQQISVTAGTRYAFNAYYSVLDLPLDTCHLKASIGGTTIAEAEIYAGAGGGNPPRYYKLEGIHRAPATATTNLLLELWCDYSSIGGVFGLDDVSFV